ncbi:hypothetical protein EYZ11_001712 [Aspergillus tanneri]|uniref:Biogenesis of lysosome-related organelles complex 1 subunit 1 n=1 Tax=Aspergillus tanneri TaxID=1220188 RepID=A0A4V3UQE9_9EURO|nr:hypothetical protein EYZ11_001712 [Aspergillus tanneri]
MTSTQPSSSSLPSTNTTNTNTNTNVTANVNVNNNNNPTTSPPYQSQSQSQQAAEAKAAFTASLRSVGANHETELRERARMIHENASALTKQETGLHRATEGLRKQNDQWAKVADQARDGLKEIGDVQNWAELIERDLLVVEETVRLAEEREGRRSGSDGEGEEMNGNGDVKGKGKSGWFWW